MLVIGLMSGTSADAVDAALVEWPEGREAQPFRLLGYLERAYPAELQTRIHTLAAGTLPGQTLLRELVALDVLLADRFAAAACEVAEQAGVAMDRIRAVASHGQTVAHHPELGATLQIGCPARLAERTGCEVVADFRRRDMALGGEGAPLAPFFHAAVMSCPGEPRGVLNLGGIANLTWLPGEPDGAGVLGFDVGPANSLVDGVVEILTSGRDRMDRGGERASRGRVDEALLTEWLADEFFARPPPKSTGRERYGRAEAEAIVRSWKHARSGSDDDLVATVSALTVRAVARACLELLPPGTGRPPGTAPIDRLFVGGGGARNPVMMSGLADALPGVIVEPFESAGIPSEAAEAMAFSLLGRNALLGLPNHLPRTTGARRAGVLGARIPAPLRA